MKQFMKSSTDDKNNLIETNEFSAKVVEEGLKPEKAKRFNFKKLSEKKEKLGSEKEKPEKIKSAKKTETGDKNKHRETQKSKNLVNNIKLKPKLFIMSILPMFILGGVVLILVYNTYVSSSVQQIESDLNAIVSTTRASFGTAGDYQIRPAHIEQDIWKGGSNVSNSTELLGEIKDRTGTDITIISLQVLGETKGHIGITTAIYEDGTRQEYILGEKIMEYIFEGKEVFSDNLYVDGEQQYMYSVPLLQDSNGKVFGAIIVSANKNAKLATTNSVIKKVILTTLIVIIVSAIFTVLMAGNITKGFKAGFGVLESVAKGKLNVNTSKLDIGRRDEIGDMFRNIVDLQESLRNIIKKNVLMSNNIEEDVHVLDDKAIQAKDSVGLVDDAINTMTSAAHKQSHIADKVTSDIGILGDMIEETYNSIQKLNTFNIELKSSNKTANRVLEDLGGIKLVLNRIIDAINIQTKKTYNLTKDIKKYAAMITDCAEETNLLALNATIEAARVGEKGKGFAIVARQIQALADQSNKVSDDITTSVRILVDDTKKSVNTMKDVTDIIDKLNTNIEDTKDVFEVVNVNVGRSIAGLKDIEEQAATMDATRGSITGVVKELEDVIKDNQESAANTKEVSNHIGALFEQTKNIKDATEELLESMKSFEI